MSHIYDSTARYRPHVSNHFTHVQKHGQRISLNASLPFHSKLNIRINANRTHQNQVKATATIQRLDPRYEYKHIQGLKQAYTTHYSTLTPSENRERNIPIQYEKFPAHRQISLPVSLPIDQRLFLYIHNGEIFARC